MTAARLQVLAAAVLFSTGGAVIKAISLDGWQVACYRSAVAAVAVLLMMPAARRRPEGRVLLVSLAYAGALVCYVLANKNTTAASCVFLVSTSPLYVLVLGWWWLGEPLRRWDVLYMAVLTVGFALFFVDAGPALGTAPRPLLGNVLAAVSGLFFALLLLGLRWLSRIDGDRGQGPAAVFYGNILAAAVCLPLALRGGPWADGDGLAILYLGVLQIGLAYVFLSAAIRVLPAFEVSLLVLLEPVLSPLWAWAAHGESPGSWALAGGALILVATAAKTLLEWSLQPDYETS